MLILKKIALSFIPLMGLQAFPLFHIDIKWGQTSVFNGKETYVYRDAKVWLDRSSEWDWSKTGTHHVPGIQIADIAEFINDVDIVILTRGMDLVLQVPEATIDYVTACGKQCYVGQTEEMVKLYNQLVSEGKKVGGVFHSTC